MERKAYRYLILLAGLVTLGFSGIAMAASPNHLNVASDFDKWLTDFRKEAESNGISKETLDAALQGAQPIPAVLKLDKKQPELVKTFKQYISTVLTKNKIEQGRQRLHENKQLLNEVSAKYPVQERFIVALWGIETHYGKITGDFNVVHALATLAYDGRRSEFFRKELLNALKIIDSKHITVQEMKGSWAGAMGESQFMPSSYLEFAVDYNQDGKPDIWKTRADIFASIANYLAKSGWNHNQTWGVRVKLPAEFDYNNVDINIKKDINEWKALGVKLANDKEIPASEGKVSIISPDGTKNIKKTGPYYLVYDNFRVLLKWNRSLYFATVVGLLSDRIK